MFTELPEFMAGTAREALWAAVGNARDRIEQEERGFAAFFTIVNERPYLYRIIRQAEFVDPDAFRTSSACDGLTGRGSRSRPTSSTR